MKAQKGYYSLLQYCPDASRLEAVNVGVVLFCPESQFLAVRTSRNNTRARKLVGRREFDLASLTSAKLAIEKRLQTDREAFQSIEAFQHFVDTRANALQLTAPRSIKVLDPQECLEKLYRELVGGPLRTTTRRPSMSKLDQVFQQLSSQGRAKLNIDVTIPVLQRRLEIPYAYQNGVFNLVKPHCFSGQESAAVNTAMRFAIEGDLIFKHPIDLQPKSQLIVVPTFDRADVSDTLERRIDDILRQYNVKTVLANQVDAFADDVLQHAHA